MLRQSGVESEILHSVPILIIGRRHSCLVLKCLYEVGDIGITHFLAGFGHIFY